MCVYESICSYVRTYAHIMWRKTFKHRHSVTPTIAFRVLLAGLRINNVLFSNLASSAAVVSVVSLRTHFF